MWFKNKKKKQSKTLSSTISTVLMIHVNQFAALMLFFPTLTIQKKKHMRSKKECGTGSDTTFSACFQLFPQGRPRRHRSAFHVKITIAAPMQAMVTGWVQDSFWVMWRSKVKQLQPTVVFPVDCLNSSERCCLSREMNICWKANTFLSLTKSHWQRDGGDKMQLCCTCHLPVLKFQPFSKMLARV